VILSNGGGMLKIMEKIVPVAGALTVAVLVLSVIHEYGYFIVIGTGFQSLLGPSDYLSNAILWLPIIGACAYSLVDSAALVEETTLRFIKWKKWQILLIVIVLIAIVTFNALFATSMLPYLFTSLLIFIFVWTIICARIAPITSGLDDTERTTRTLFRIVPPFLGAILIWGMITGDLDTRSIVGPYVIKTSKMDAPKTRFLLRTFDKGILIRNPEFSTIEFYKWADVESISKQIVIERTWGCQLFGRGCHF
jgi:hypothetical protein